MKKINTYFLTGLLLLLPIFILYQAITIISSVAKSFVELPLLINFMLSIIAILALGWIMIHIFKTRLKKRLKNLSKRSGMFGFFALAILEFDTASDKTHAAFKNPVLYKVDDGIYKLGYITNKDISFVNTPTEGATEATPAKGAVWVYAPYPVNFFGEMVLVEKRKIQKLNTEELHNLPLFILSGGLLKK